jgi:hypothetical protein
MEAKRWWRPIARARLSTKRRGNRAGRCALTIVVAKGIPDAEGASEELKDFLKERESLNAEQAKAKVTAITTVARDRHTLWKRKSDGILMSAVALADKIVVGSCALYKHSMLRPWGRHGRGPIFLLRANEEAHAP